MPIFSAEYPSKSKPVANDKFLISDSEAAGAIKGVSRQALQNELIGGNLKDIKYITASGNYVKPANLKYVIVELVGGGGAGGGASATSSSQASVGAGGSAGGYSRKKILASDLFATETVTIGAGGTGGTSSGNDGGSTSFGSHLSATGGGGSYGGGTLSAQAWGPLAAGMGIGGDFNLQGGPGGFGTTIGSGSERSISGNGGASYFGGGGRGSNGTGSNDTYQGDDAMNYGSGGSGAKNSGTQTAKRGGRGKSGIVIVYEYF